MPGIEIASARWMRPKPAGASSTSDRIRSGERSATAVATAPPSECPTSTASLTSSSASAHVTASAYAEIRGRVGASEPPKPGRSSATHGRGVARAIPSQPAAQSSSPCSKTSGAPAPGHRQPHRRRPAGVTSSNR